MNLKSLKLTMLSVSTIIGAGFASGKEVVTFFTRFGYLSIGLIIIVSVLFYYSSKIFLESSELIKPKNFSDVNIFLMKKRYMIFDLVVVVCSLVSLGAMTAGSNALGHILVEEYNSVIIGIITLILGAIIAYGGIKLINNVSVIVVPLILIIIVATSVLSFINIFPNSKINYNPTVFQDYFMGTGSAILYVCLNMLLSGYLLMEVGKNYTKKEIKFASLLFSIIIGAFIFIINISMLLSNFSIFNSELPLIALSININYAWGVVIAVIVWIAIVTSIVSTIYVVSKYFMRFFKSYFISLLFSAVVGYFISIIGFGNIVRYIYPVMGLFGFILIILLVVHNGKVGMMSKNIHSNKKLKHSTMQ